MSSDRPPAKRKLKPATLFELMKEKNSNKGIYNLYNSIILVNTIHLQYNIIYFDLHSFIYPTHTLAYLSFGSDLTMSNAP